MQARTLMPLLPLLLQIAFSVAVFLDGQEPKQLHSSRERAGPLQMRIKEPEVEEKGTSLCGSSCSFMEPFEGEGERILRPRSFRYLDRRSMLQRPQQLELPTGYVEQKPVSPNLKFVSRKKVFPLPSKKSYYESKHVGREVQSGIEFQKDFVSKQPNMILQQTLIYNPILLSKTERSSARSTFMQRELDLPKSENVIRYMFHENTSAVTNFTSSVAMPLDWVTTVGKTFFSSPFRQQNLKVSFNETRVHPQYFSNSLRNDSLINGKHPSELKLNDQKSHRRGSRSADSPSMPSKNCHSQHLHKCGPNVIQKFSMNPDSPYKCKIREEFLDCMVQQRKRDCPPLEESPFSPEDTNSIRTKVKNLLWSAHGCLLI